MSRSLTDLCPRVRGRVFEALARMVGADVPVKVIDTLRTPAEQADNIRKGVSWTKNSLHLPQKDCPGCMTVGGLAHAIDVAPYDVFDAHGMDKLNWDAKDPRWDIVGECYILAGMEWGGVWKIPDLGHGQWRGPRRETT